MDAKPKTVNRRVHVVDDEPDLRDSIALMLSTAGIETVGHESAERFLSGAPIHLPLLVVLDNRLPGISGLELLRALRERGSPAAVIMLTGHADVPTAVAAMRLGAFHFIEKPFDGEALLCTIEEALSRADQVRDEIAEAEAFRSRRKSLTQREVEVLGLLIEGLPTKVIAGRLEITSRTAEHHRAAVMRKLDARSISHLIRMAINLNSSLPSS